MAGEKSEIEAAKLDLEKQKLVLEDKWKKRTYVWTILSALLTAGVTLTIAFFPAKETKKQVSLQVGPVENCLNSLKRTDTLSKLGDQELPALVNAVQIHVGNCEGVLQTLVDELK